MAERPFKRIWLPIGAIFCAAVLWAGALVPALAGPGPGGGDSVDDEVDGKVDDQVDQKVEDQVNDQVDDTVNDSVQDQVDDSVQDQVQDNVEDSAQNDVEDQIEGGVEDSASSSIDGKIADQVDRKIDDKSGSGSGTVETKIADRIDGDGASGPGDGGTIDGQVDKMDGGSSGGSDPIKVALDAQMAEAKATLDAEIAAADAAYDAARKAAEAERDAALAAPGADKDAIETAYKLELAAADAQHESAINDAKAGYESTDQSIKLAEASTSGSGDSGSSGGSGSGDDGSNSGSSGSGSGDGDHHDGGNSGEGSSGSSSGTGDGSGSGGASRSGDNERVFVAGVDDNGDEVEQGEWLILTTTDAANALIAQGFVARRLEQLDGLGLVLVQVAAPDTQTFAAAKAIIKRTAPAASIDYNHVYFASSAPPEIHRAGAEPAALMTMPSEGEGRVIGIIDTGIDVAHPALAGAHITAQDFASYVGRRPLDHGTAVASILAGGGDGFRGLAPRAEIYAASVFFSPDGGGEIATTASLVRALDWMIDRGVHIVNMSLTGPQNAILQSAIDRAYERGVLVVAAVGNEGPAAGPLYPAAYKNVVGVTAVSRAKKIYRLANRGDYVDFAAPGVDIEHAAEGGGFAASSGTSMAAPFVAAVLAEECQSTTGEVGEACLAALMRNAEDLGPRGYDPIFGHGLIRAVAAMR